MGIRILKYNPTIEIDENINEIEKNTDPALLPKVKFLFAENTNMDMASSAVFGYYSRSHKSTEELIEQALSCYDPKNKVFTDKEEYKRFIETWITNYHHNSLSEHPSLHFYVENISNVATKTLEECSMGQNGVPVAYMEKSTRFVTFAFRNNKRYERIFNKICLIKENENENHDFNIRKAIIENKMKNLIETQMNMYEEMDEFYKELIEKINKENNLNIPTNKSFDSSRMFLPSLIPTVVGVSLNARSAKAMIIRLLTSDLIEAQYIGLQLFKGCVSKWPYMFTISEITNDVKQIRAVDSELLNKIDTIEKPEKKFRYLMNLNPGKYGYIRNLYYVSDEKEKVEVFDIDKVISSINDGSTEIRIRDVQSMNDGYGYDGGHISTVVNVEDKFLSNASVIFTGGELMQKLKNTLSAAAKVNKDFYGEESKNKSIFDNFFFEKEMSTIRAVVETEVDYGAYRDFQRHRKLNFIAKNEYTNNFDLILGSYFLDKLFYPFEYILDPILSIQAVVGYTSEEDREIYKKAHDKMKEYYKKITLEILYILKEYRDLLVSHLNHHKEKLILDINSYLLEIASYLTPMSAVKKFTFCGSLIDILRVLDERTQPAGHLSYRLASYAIFDKLAEDLDDDDRSSKGSIKREKLESWMRYVPFDKETVKEIWLKLDKDSVEELEKRINFVSSFMCYGKIKE